MTGSEPRHADVPVRDFEAGITGALQVEGGQAEDPALAVIMTTDRGVEGYLHAGEGLSRLLVGAQQQGLAASIISQPVDWPVVRERMRGLMSWADYPQIPGPYRLAGGRRDRRPHAAPAHGRRDRPGLATADTVLSIASDGPVTAALGESG